MKAKVSEWEKAVIVGGTKWLVVDVESCVLGLLTDTREDIASSGISSSFHGKKRKQ